MPVLTKTIAGGTVVERTTDVPSEITTLRATGWGLKPPEQTPQEPQEGPEEAAPPATTPEPAKAAVKPARAAVKPAAKPARAGA